MTDPTPVVLDRGDLSTLIQLTGIAPAMCSPLLGIVAEAEPADDSRVREQIATTGWLSDGPESGLTDEALAAVVSLLRPAISGRAVLGTRQEIGVLGLYAANPAGPYVALSEALGTGEYLITPGRAFSDLSNAVTEQVLLGPMEASMSFGAEFDAGEFAVLSAVLDWRTRTLLQATLDRDPSPDVQFTAREAWEMLVEGASSDDPAWAVTLFMSLVPQVEINISEDKVEAALGRLSEAGLVSAAGERGWRFSELLESLAESLQPFGSYAAVHLEAWDGDEPIEASHLAFVRGPFALVVIRPMTEGGLHTVTVDAITDIELADLLTDLAATPSVAGTATAAPVCPHCGAQVERDQKFCAKCGEDLGNVGLAGATRCPSCGADVDLNEGAFCSQCGAPVAGLPADGGAS